MKRLLFLMVCIISISAFAQQTTVDLSPLANPVPNATMQRDTFNLQFTFPPTAFVGDYGIESNGTDIYVTQWLEDSIARYDQLGNVIEAFVIPGVGHVRDLAYDGQYYYGSPSANYFYVLDLDNKILIDTIHTSFNIRGMAYDPIEDVLWASSNWEPEFHKMDMQGNVLDSWIASGQTMNAISGLAYDNSTAGGPFLWGFSQDSTGAVIVKYDIATQSQTGNMINMSSLEPSGIAGGLFINNMTARTGETLGGMIQNYLVFAFDLAYANMMVVGIEDHSMITSLEIYPNPVKDIMNINIELNNEDELTCNIVNLIGQVVHSEKVLSSSSSTISINTSEFRSGTYFVQLSSNKGYSIAKKFIIVE
jgi:type IX secretion system substrate protein